MAELTMEAVQALIESKLAAQKEELNKDFDVRVNKINSSWAKKVKQAAPVVEDDEVETDTDQPARRLSKKETEANANVEKLVKMLETERSNTRLEKFKNTFSEQLLKNGYNPEAVDTVYTLYKAKGAFVDNGDSGFQVKVNVEGNELPLSVESAVKHMAALPESKFFLAPRGVGGSGAAKTSSSPGTNSSASTGDIKQRLSPDNVAKSLGIDLGSALKALANS